MSLLAKEHAPLPPSGANSWVRCAAWRAMNQAYPQSDTDASTEGTAAHWCFESQVMPKEGTVAPNGVVITDDMIEGAELFLETIGDRTKGFVEQRVAMHQIHNDNWGTPDFFSFHGGKLRVVDYKFGHRYVDAYENWQLIDYAFGALAHRGYTDDEDMPIELTIVQPRHYCKDGPVRTWNTSLSALRMSRTTLARAAERAMEPNPVATPGDEQCHYCPGRHACEALQASALDAVEWSGDSVPLELTPTAAARELRALMRAAERIGARRSGLEARLLADLRAGKPVPGFAAEQGEGRQRWSKPVPEILALGDLMGVKLGVPKVVTPRQAIKAGLPEAVVAGMSDTPKGEWKLVEVDLRKSAQVFNQGVK